MGVKLVNGTGATSADLHKRRAEFYARLASIPDLRALSQTARRRLGRQFEAASAMKVRQGFGGLTKNDFIYNLEFRGLHHFTRATLGALLDGQPVRVSPTELPPPVWRLEDRGVVQTWPIQELWQTPVAEFVGLLFQQPFPFRRCPVCEKFFARVGRQRYCTTSCASRGIESARKDSKREYMRKYMAMRRAKARKIGLDK